MGLMKKLAQATGLLSSEKTEAKNSPQLSPEEQEKKERSMLLALIMQVRTISAQVIDQSGTQLSTRELYTQQRTIARFLEKATLPLVSQQLQQKIPKYAKRITAELETAKKDVNARAALIDAHKYLENVIDAIEAEIVTDDESKELLEFKQHVEHVVHLIAETREAKKRRIELKRKRELIKLLLAAVLIEEMDATEEKREHNIKLQKQSKIDMTASRITTINYLTNDEIIDIAEEVLELNREDIIKLNPDLSHKDEIHQLQMFDSYSAPKMTAETRRKVVTSLNNNLDAHVKRNSTELTIEDAQNILKNLRSKKIPLDIIAIEDLLYLNEVELIDSEISGPNALKLYEEAFLKSDYFHKSGEKKFMGHYLMLVVLGLINNDRNDETYNPLSFSKQLTQYFIVDAYSKRRAIDSETASGSRWLAVEELLTYFAWGKESFNFSAANPEEKAKIVDELLNWFWWNEVGRPTVVYLAQDGSETEDRNLAQKDEFGPIVLRIYNKENVQFPVAREHGKYLLRKKLTKEGREQIKQVDQEMFVASTVYFQLHEMINGRRTKGDAIGVEETPLGIKKEYVISVAIGNQWRKIKIDGSYFTSDTHGKPGSIESLAEFLLEYKQIFFATDDSSAETQERITNGSCSQLHEFDERSLGKLKHAADKAYSTSVRNREKYQDMQSKIDDLDDFTAADFGISFIGSLDANRTDPLMRSILTNNFGGRKQLNILFGVDQQGNISDVVETVTHKFLDGAPARVESEKVLEHSLEATKKVSTLARPLKTNIINREIDQYEEDGENASKIYTGRIEGGDGYFRERCSNIYKFYKEQLGVDIDKNTIIQLAVHIFLGISHTHFLESRDGILAPALSSYPEKVLLRLQYADLTQDEMLELLAASQVMKADRLAIKNGGGMVPTSAMLTGAHSASAFLRKIIQGMAETLHKEVTLPLTRTALVSSVSGSAKPFPTHPLFEQDTFTTALDKVYLDHGAFGFSDVGEDISITYRTLKNQEVDFENFNDEFNSALSTVFAALEKGMQHFQPDKKQYRRKTNWRKDFERQAKERQLQA